MSSPLSAFFPIISIHALREEGDPTSRASNGCGADFYPRPPRGGRQMPSKMFSLSSIFLSTPSARRATAAARAEAKAKAFLSTPSARRATVHRQLDVLPPFISIHALREEGDPLFLRLSSRMFISIHALREEGDLLRSNNYPLTKDFYPRPPRGGRPPKDGKYPQGVLDFYPRPPRGGRQQKQRQNLYFLINYTTFCTNLEEL